MYRRKSFRRKTFRRSSKGLAKLSFKLKRAARVAKRRSGIRRRRAQRKVLKRGADLHPVKGCGWDMTVHVPPADGDTANIFPIYLRAPNDYYPISGTTAIDPFTRFVEMGDLPKVVQLIRSAEFNYHRVKYRKYRITKFTMSYTPSKNGMYAAVNSSGAVTASCPIPIVGHFLIADMSKDPQFWVSLIANYSFENGNRFLACMREHPDVRVVPAARSWRVSCRPSHWGASLAAAIPGSIPVPSPPISDGDATATVSRSYINNKGTTNTTSPLIPSFDATIWFSFLVAYIPPLNANAEIAPGTGDDDSIFHGDIGKLTMMEYVTYKGTDFAFNPDDFQDDFILKPITSTKTSFVPDLFPPPTTPAPMEDSEWESDTEDDEEPKFVQAVQELAIDHKARARQLRSV